MSVLASLNRAYERLAERREVPLFGYSAEKIGYLIALAENGTPVGISDRSAGGGGQKAYRSANERAAAGQAYVRHRAEFSLGQDFLCPRRDRGTKSPHCSGACGIRFPP